MYYEENEKSFEELEKEFLSMSAKKQMDQIFAFDDACMRGADTSDWYFHKYLDNRLNDYVEKDFWDLKYR